MYREIDIKWEGKRFAVIYCKERDRYEILKSGITHSEVVGWGTKTDCIRVAAKLDRYAKPFPL